jgi:hypothetical protein
MVYDLELQVAFRNASRQGNAVTQATAYANQFAADLYVPAQIGPFNGVYKWGADWQFAVACWMRFTALAPRDDLWNQLDALLGSGNQGPVQGSARGGRGQRLDLDEAQEMTVVQAYPERAW